MTYASLSVLGLEEVRQLSDPRVDFLLSILAVDDRFPRPAWVSAKHYLALTFDDLDDPNIQDGLHVPPRSSDVQTILGWGRRVRRAQRGQDAPLSALIHCTAGISRSTAAAYAIWCDWLGTGAEEQAVAAVRADRPNASPNRLMVAYADELLHRKGRLLAAAAAFYPSF